MKQQLFCRLKKIIYSSRSDAGQSLVEFAIILPVLILMLLGVFEVGWALRGYLTLANVNREATRFAARGIYLDFDQTDPSLVGYEKVVTHTIDSLSEQLSMDFFSGNPNAAEFITFYKIEPTGFNCLGDSTCAGFTCSRFDYEHRNDANFVPGENLNLISYPLLVPPAGVHPNLPAYYNQVLTMTNTTAYTAYYYQVGAPNIYSRIDPKDMVIELRSRMNAQNCELVKKKLPPTNSSFVVVENIYFQHQLVGLPLINRWVPDPVPFYTHTVMRVTDNIRESLQETEEGCSLYPIMVPLSKVTGINRASTVTLDVENDPDIAAGNFGFVHWKSSEPASTANPDQPNGQYGLPNNILHPENAASDFEEPDTTPTDTQINIGDWVEVQTGVNNSSNVRNPLNALITSGTLMRMPVWYDSDCATGCTGVQSDGSNAKFRVYTFVVMKIIGENLPQDLTFQFSHFEANACPGDDRG